MAGVARAGLARGTCPCECGSWCRERSSPLPSRCLFVGGIFIRCSPFCVRLKQVPVKVPVKGDSHDDVVNFLRSKIGKVPVFADVLRRKLTTSS